MNKCSIILNHYRETHDEHNFSGRLEQFIGDVIFLDEVIQGVSRLASFDEVLTRRIQVYIKHHRFNKLKSLVDALLLRSQSTPKQPLILRAHLFALKATIANIQADYRKAAMFYRVATGHLIPVQPIRVKLAIRCLEGEVQALTQYQSYHSAIDALEQVIQLRKTYQSNENLLLAENYKQLAKLYYQRGLGDPMDIFYRQREVSSSYYQAQLVMEKALGKNHPKLVSILNARASIMADNAGTDNKSQAIELYQRSLAILDKQENLDAKYFYDLTSTLYGLAYNYSKTDRKSDALPLYQRLLVLETEHYGEFSKELFEVLNRLADNYYFLGDHIQEAVMLEKVLLIEEKNQIYNRQTFSFLIRAYRFSKQNNKVTQTYQRYIAQARTYEGVDDSSVAKIEQKLAEFERFIKDKRKH